MSKRVTENFYFSNKSKELHLYVDKRQVNQPHRTDSFFNEWIATSVEQ